MLEAEQGTLVPAKQNIKKLARYTVILLDITIFKKRIQKFWNWHLGQEQQEQVLTANLN